MKFLQKTLSILVAVFIMSAFVPAQFSQAELGKVSLSFIKPDDLPQVAFTVFVPNGLRVNAMNEYTSENFDAGIGSVSLSILGGYQLQPHVSYYVTSPTTANFVVSEGSTTSIKFILEKIQTDGVAKINFDAPPNLFSIPFEIIMPGGTKQSGTNQYFNSTHVSGLSLLELKLDGYQIVGESAYTLYGAKMIGFRVLPQDTKMFTVKITQQVSQPSTPQTQPSTTATTPPPTEPVISTLYTTVKPTEPTPPPSPQFGWLKVHVNKPSSLAIAPFTVIAPNGKRYGVANSYTNLNYPIGSTVIQLDTTNQYQLEPHPSYVMTSEKTAEVVVSPSSLTEVTLYIGEVGQSGSVKFSFRGVSDLQPVPFEITMPGGETVRGINSYENSKFPAGRSVIDVKLKTYYLNNESGYTPLTSTTAGISLLPEENKVFTIKLIKKVQGALLPGMIFEVEEVPSDFLASQEPASEEEIVVVTKKPKQKLERKQLQTKYVTSKELQEQCLYQDNDTDAVKYLCMLGVIDQPTNERDYVGLRKDYGFNGDNVISRAEFTKMMISMTYEDEEIQNLQDTAFRTGYRSFPDVNESEWYALAIAVAKYNGHVQGYPNGKFMPAKTIEMSEALKILFNAASHDNEKVRKDLTEAKIKAGKNAVWYKPYADLARKFKGFEPKLDRALGLIYNQTLSRQRAADLIYTIIQNAGIVGNPSRTARLSNLKKKLVELQKNEGDRLTMSKLFL